MNKRNRVAVTLLVAVLLILAAILCISLPRDGEPEEPVAGEPSAEVLDGWDHSQQGYTCSICHSPPRTHAAMTFNRCEDCHAYPTWDAPHPEETDCLKCHTLPAKHLAINAACTTCHPEVGESWRFVHSGELICGDCHTAPAEHWGNDCERCHSPGDEWAEGQYPHSASMNCAECHDAPHRVYTETSCVSCHPAVGVSWAFRHFTPKSCASCHEARRPASHPTGDCVSCHRTSGWTPAIHPDASSACAICHTPPHGAYAVTCTGCHPSVAVAWKFTHPQVLSCTPCHEPMRPAGHPAGDCVACHVTSGWTPATHPAASATCTSCHAPKADTATTAHPATVCASCHPIPPATWLDATHPDGTAACEDCHSPDHIGAWPTTDCDQCHASVGVTWLPVTHPAASATCTSCHAPKADTATTNHPTTVCADCHAVPPATWADALHPAATATCSTCHIAPVPHCTSKPCSTCHSPSITWAFDHPGDSSSPASCSSCHRGTVADFHGACVGCHTGHVEEPWAPLPDETSDCASCHAGTTWVHEDTCLNCHTAFELGTIAPGAAQVPWTYATGHDDSILVGNCTDCHADNCGNHPAPTADCATCHEAKPDTVTTNHPATVCADCHTVPPATWADATHPDTTATCSTCHIAPVPHYGTDCALCHDPSIPWADATVDHSVPNLDCEACHTTTTATHTAPVTCDPCHAASNIVSVHGDVCTTCHPTPADSMIGAWTGSCTQAGCHVAPLHATDASHATTDAYHNGGTNCWPCHDPDPSLSDCEDCHGGPAYDRIPPVTSSDVQSAYLGDALIRLFPVDPPTPNSGNGPPGGTWGIKATYFILDGGPIQTGTTISVPAPAAGAETHIIEYWSLDAMLNVEAPHRSATFTVAPAAYTSPLITFAIAGNAQASLIWTPITGATGYEVQRAASPTFAVVTSVMRTDPNLTDALLVNGTYYYYRVRALGPDGQSGWSPTATVRPLPPVPAAPTFTSVVPGNGSVALTWGAVQYATGYNLQRSTSPTFTSFVWLRSNSPLLSYSDVGRTNGVTYYYRVQAVSSLSGIGPWTVTSATPRLPLGTLSSVVEGTGWRLTWSGGVAPYTVVSNGADLASAATATYLFDPAAEGTYTLQVRDSAGAVSNSVIAIKGGGTPPVGDTTTLYFNHVTRTVNGMGGYELTPTMTAFGNLDIGLAWQGLYASVRAYRLTAAGVLIPLTGWGATVIEPYADPHGDYNNFLTADYAFPGWTGGDPNDAIVVDVGISGAAGVPGTTRRFITQPIGATSAVAETWTIRYALFNGFYSFEDMNYAEFVYGTAGGWGADSNISGITNYWAVAPLTAPTAAASGGGYTLAWTGGRAPYQVLVNGATAGTTSALSYSWTPAAPGTYSVTVRDALGTVSAATSVTVAGPAVTTQLYFSGASHTVNTLAANQMTEVAPNTWGELNMGTANPLVYVYTRTWRLSSTGTLTAVTNWGGEASEGYTFARVSGDDALRTVSYDFPGWTGGQATDALVVDVGVGSSPGVVASYHRFVTQPLGTTAPSAGTWTIDYYLFNGESADDGEDYGEFIYGVAGVPSKIGGITDYWP